MSTFFLTLLNRCIAANWLILFAILLRLVLKKSPKWLSCLLWAFVAVRLLCPFSIESALSLIPSAETFQLYNLQYETPKAYTGIHALDNALDPVLESTLLPDPAGSANPAYTLLFVTGCLWAVGFTAFLLYAAVSLLLLYRRVQGSVLLRENIWIGDAVRSPFILGLLRPRIYLPSGMEEVYREPVIAHERAHLARRDHWWKALGFLLLAVYWFDPLCWAAYVLLCRDIEFACDEKVIRPMDFLARKTYAHALVACGSQRFPVPACPLAFGEIGVKERVKNVLNYKKPAFGNVLIGIAACAALAVCFLTDPKAANVDSAYVMLKEVSSVPRYASGQYTFHSGAEVSNRQLVIEQWSNGECIERNSVLLNPQEENFQLTLIPRSEDSSVTGLNVQVLVGDENIGFAYYYPVLSGYSVRGWAFSSLTIAQEVPVSTGKSYVIAAWNPDLGNGVPCYSCEALTEDEKYIKEAAIMVVVRAECTGEGETASVAKQTDL